MNARRIARLLAVVWSVAGVTLLTTLLVGSLFDVDLSSFRPAYNDEVAYWHQTATFARVGWQGGYYTADEVTNPSGFTPSGPHGPGFAALFGTAGSLIGWYFDTPVMLNLAAIGAAAWLFIALARLPTPRIWLLGLLLVSFWPLLLMVPTAMQESLHAAGAISIAGFFAYVLRGGSARSVIVFGWLWLSVLALVRPSWLLFLPVWALASTNGHRRWVALAGSIALAGALLFAYTSTVAPYGDGFFFLQVFSLRESANAVWLNAATNVHRMTDVRGSMALEVVHRAQYFGWMLAGIVLLVRARRRQRHPEPHLIASMVIPWTAMLLTIVVYTVGDWIDFRVLSAFLLFGAVLSLAAPGRPGVMLPVLLVATSLLTAPIFLGTYRELREANFAWDRAMLYEFTKGIEGKIVYQSDAPRWCNTLLTSQYPAQLIAVPPEIGLSVLRDPEALRLPPRSKYLLLDDEARGALQRPIRVTSLAAFPFATLYLNLEAECD